MTSTMFYGDIKFDFREEKITLAMFNGDIKLILELRENYFGDV